MTRPDSDQCLLDCNEENGGAAEMEVEGAIMDTLGRLLDLPLESYSHINMYGSVTLVEV